MAHEQDPSLHHPYNDPGRMIPELFWVERHKPWTIAAWAIGLIVVLASIGSYVSTHRGGENMGAHRSDPAPAAAAMP